MSNDNDLVERGLAAYGAFTRVVRPDESAFGYGGSYVDEQTVALETETRAGDLLISTRTTPAEEPLENDLRRSGHAVTIYLDGRLVRTAEWKGHPGEWAVTMPLDRGHIAILTNSEHPLPELTLVSSTGSDA